VLSAAELHARGVALINEGRVGAARAPLRRALDRTSDPSLLGAVEASLAYVEAETGRRDEAARLCASALARDLSDETLGTVLSQRALLSMLEGHSSAALREFDAAVPLLDGLALARAHLNRGTLHLELHDPVRAVEEFERALQHYGDDAPAVETAMTRHNLGYARLLTGDLPGALVAMDRAREVLAPLSPVAAATCDQDRAEVLMAAGLVGDALVALAASARAAGAARLRRRQGEAELSLARALLPLDPRGAARTAARAARRFQRDGVPGWQARAEAVRTSAEAESGVAIDEGRAADLVATLRREGLEAAARQVELAAVRSLAHQGRDVAARTAMARLRPRASDPLAVRLQGRDVRAELATRRSDALRHLRAGLDDLHAWQSSFGSLDLQTNVVGLGVRLGVRGLALAVESASDAVLLEWSERARMLASRVQPVRAPQDPATAADLAELRTAPGPEREAELRRRVRERAWQRRGSGAYAAPATLDAVVAGLGRDTALAAYVVTAERVVALVVTDAGTRRHDLGGRAALDGLLGGLLADLDTSAGAGLPAAVSAVVRASLAERLGRLAALLVAPLLPSLGGRRVVLTPSGVLAGVPWTLLPGYAGRPVTVAQSATSWLERTRSPLRLASAGFVAGPRVPRAEAEVRAGAVAWPGATVLTGSSAAAGAVTDLAGRVDVLHVAAHGRHAADNPLFSGLELVDGPWCGYDVDQLASVPDVVLLSACEVGRSSVRWGEELIGMSAAWLHAGARCVVASPASVADDAAHDTLVRVHRALATGSDPADALAGAVHPVTLDAAPAPFVCFG
jgi:tetratricopeptide (TPR) repeat protein